MSNRARRAHTHGLRQRLMPKPRNLLTVTITLHGASRHMRSAAGAVAKTKGMARGVFTAGP